MPTMTPRTLSGFMELLPAPQQQMERIMSVLRETYSLYGFTPLDTPIIESSEVLLAKGGGFILSTGCEYPAAESDHMARIIVEEAKTYGAYKK